MPMQQVCLLPPLILVAFFHISSSPPPPHSSAARVSQEEMLGPLVQPGLRSFLSLVCGSVSPVLVLGLFRFPRISRQVLLGPWH